MEPRYRTEVESLFLSEMVEEDRAFINLGDVNDIDIDGITVDNTDSLFADTTSTDDSDFEYDGYGEDYDD